MFRKNDKFDFLCNNNKKEEYFRAIYNCQDRKIKLRMIN